MDQPSHHPLTKAILDQNLVELEVILKRNEWVADDISTPFANTTETRYISSKLQVGWGMVGGWGTA